MLWDGRQQGGAAEGPTMLPSRRHLYLERASLIDITERPVIVTGRPASGEQTQIIRRPTRRATAVQPSGRKLWIFGSAAATAMLLVTWLVVGQRADMNRRAEPMPRGERPGSSVTSVVASPSRPIVAPVAEAGPWAVRSTQARLAGKKRGALHASTRLAHHTVKARRAAKVATVAWVDPFVDR